MQRILDGCRCFVLSRHVFQGMLLYQEKDLGSSCVDARHVSSVEEPINLEILQNR